MPHADETRQLRLLADDRGIGLRLRLRLGDSRCRQNSTCGTRCAGSISSSITCHVSMSLVTDGPGAVLAPPLLDGGQWGGHVSIDLKGDGHPEIFGNHAVKLQFWAYI